MPRTPSDYSKTIIYKLCCKDVAITEIYVGHTTNFTRRKQNHKESCNYEKNKDYNIYKSQFIRANGGFENWAMIQLEAYPCQNKREAEMQERYWIELLKPKLNSMIPFRTEEELKELGNICCAKYYELNKEKILERDKQYRELNKEQLKEKRKLRNLNKKENKKCSDIV